MTPRLKGFGVNVDINHFEASEIDKLINALLKIGAYWVRLEIDYLKYEDEIKLSAVDYFCAECKKNNIIIVGLFSIFVPASFKNLFFPQQSYTPIISDMESFLKFVSLSVHRWKEQILYWEIWNEQNSKRFWINKPSPEEYVTFLKQTQKTIHAVNKHAQIVFGGVNGNDITPMVYMPKHYFHYCEFMKECIKLGADRYVDIFAFHPYTLSCYISLKKPEAIADEIIARIQETRKEYKHQQLLISEIGVSPLLNPRLDASGIAIIYKKIISFCKQIDVPVSFYTLADQHKSHYGPFNPDRDFGFLDYDLAEKSLMQEFIA